MSVLLLCVQPSLTQQPAPALHGRVTDQLGAVIVGATVTVTNGAGEAKSTKTNNEGVFVIGGLAPGKYAVRAEAAGFAIYENTAVEIASGRPPSLNIKLAATIAEQKMNVQGNAPVSADPENNAGAIALRGKSLDALPDDPEDLRAVLEALAGPAAGPGGAQFYVDGFSAGARLPSKDSIREIRINQNPFSAEYDRLGFGSIQIITRPGTDKLHGHGVFSFGDESLNSRNPFALNRAPYQSRFYFGGISGPLIAKQATFYISGGRRETDDNAIINATVLDSSLKIATFSRAEVTPQRDGGLNLRLDLQLNPKHTLSAQYNYMQLSLENAGIGEFGRSLLDVRQRFLLGGSFNAPWGLSLSPLIILRSGTPFNITTGRDVNGDTLFTERPAFAADLARPGVIVTRFGAFDPNVSPGQQIIPRNFGDGPSFFSVNLRLSKRFSFGPRPDAPTAQSTAGQQSSGQPSSASRATASQARQPERPFSLTLAAQIQNLFNHVNAAPPIGNLASPRFGLSNATAAGGFSFGSGAPATSNRRIELQLNLNF